MIHILNNVIKYIMSLVPPISYFQFRKLPNLDREWLKNQSVSDNPLLIEISVTYLHFDIISATALSYLKSKGISGLDEAKYIAQVTDSELI